MTVVVLCDKLLILSPLVKEQCSNTKLVGIGTHIFKKETL